MRRICMLMVMTGLLAGPALGGQAEPNNPRTLKARQKHELQVLKLKKKYMKSTFSSSDMPKAVRIQMKHELKREARKLRRRQKNECQMLKDQRRLLKLEMKEFGSP